jgi:hypothetical protein
MSAETTTTPARWPASSALSTRMPTSIGTSTWSVSRLLPSSTERCSRVGCGTSTGGLSAACTPTSPTNLHRSQHSELWAVLGWLLIRASDCMTVVAFVCHRCRHAAAVSTHERFADRARASEASWDDLTAILGKVKCHGCLCFCQRYKTDFDGWRNEPDEERGHRLRMQTECDTPGSATTSGLVAYVDGKPGAGRAVEPRSSRLAADRLRRLGHAGCPSEGAQQDRDNQEQRPCCRGRPLLTLVGGTGIEPVASSVSRKSGLLLTVARWALTCSFFAECSRA